jgi:hypothetical protein
MSNPVLVEVSRPKRLWTARGTLIPPGEREYELILSMLCHNLRTNAGREWQKEQMSGTVAAVANYIAVTNTASYTPAAGDTTLSGEQTTNGLARAAGTFALNSGSAFYTLAKTFTYTGGSPITLTGAAMFNAASAGTMPFAAAFSATATLVNGDQITPTWTVNI